MYSTNTITALNLKILHEMGKRSRKDVEDSEKPEKKEKRSSSKSKSIKSLAVDEAAVDPNLALLFATSVSFYAQLIEFSG